MLLFLMGADIYTILILLILIYLIGLLIFRFSKWLLRKWIKDASDRKINILSRASAFVLAPVIVIGSFALSMYIAIQMLPQQPEEEITSDHYEMMEDELKEILKIGMSKKEVVERFGENDTTQSKVIYDLSLEEANEKYFLELIFDKGKLTSFQRMP